MCGTAATAQVHHSATARPCHDNGAQPKNESRRTNMASPESQAVEPQCFALSNSRIQAAKQRYMEHLVITTVVVIPRSV